MQESSHAAATAAAAAAASGTQVSQQHKMSGTKIVLRSAVRNEVIYAGSSKLDDQRRCVVSWVGGGDVEGESGVWSVESVEENLKKRRAAGGVMEKMTLHTILRLGDNHKILLRKWYTLVCIEALLKAQLTITQHTFHLGGHLHLTKLVE